ncbi:MAG: LysR family transcriptional regulator [Breoghania sp.]|nr:LysR family transcriptional regulator [Breoghania sp.]MDJ0931522.1 LysR family transcriptional regulator [Breoghania sp.]
MSDPLENRFLRDFICVAEGGSIRGAADWLGVAASVISRNVLDAEIRLGVQLLERNLRGVRLTSAGELVREHALQRQDENTYLFDQLQTLGEGRQQLVRIALGEGFASDLMQNGLKPLYAIHPEFCYSIDLAGTEELQRRVVQGQADIAIAYNPSISEATRSLAVQRHPLCAVVPRGSALAEGARCV